MLQLRFPEYAINPNFRKKVGSGTEFERIIKVLSEFNFGRLLETLLSASPSVLLELARFLALKALNRDINNRILSPSIIIEKLWRCLLLFPRDYSILCQKMLQSNEILDYSPNNNHQRADKYLRTIEQYRLLFSIDPIDTYWPTDETIESSEASDIEYSSSFWPTNALLPIQVESEIDKPFVPKDCKYLEDSPKHHENTEKTSQNKENESIHVNQCHQTTRFFVITIQDSFGKENDLEIRSSDKILNIKRLYQFHSGNMPEEYALQFQDQILDDNRTVSDYSINEGSLLHSVYSNRISKTSSKQITTTLTPTLISDYTLKHVYFR